MNTLFTLRSFMTPAECDALIDDAEARGFEPAPITTAGGFVMAPDIRNNARVMFDDVTLAGRLFDRLSPRLAGRAPSGPRGLNERLRFYRYAPGQAFRWHRDGRFVRGLAEASRLTFMVYLNDDFQGGHTEFRDVTVEPERGMALVFEHGLLHQGSEVLAGVKYVLRSDVMYPR